MAEAKKKLTDKERRFIEEYCGGEFRFCATKSAAAAGYSKKTAYQIGHLLLTKSHIKVATEARMNELAERCAVSKESVTKQLMDAYELALCGTVLRDGDQLPGAATASPAAAVAAAMGLAKLHGLITDKTESKNVTLTHEEWLRSLDGNGTGNTPPPS